MVQARIGVAGLLFLWSGCSASATGSVHAQAGIQSHAVDPISVQTQSWEIRFSPIGGVPMEWNIVDPRFASVNGRENGDDVIPLDVGGCRSDPDFRDDNIRFVQISW